MKQAEKKVLTLRKLDKNYLWAEDTLIYYHPDGVKVVDSFELPEISTLVLTYTVNRTKRVAVFIDRDLAWDKLTDIVSAKEVMLLYMRYSAFRNIPEGVNNLKKSDIDLLRKMGIPEGDIPIISNAMKKMVYKMSQNGSKPKRISAKKAKDLLGDEYFLSCLDRATFHTSASRETEDYSVRFELR